MNKDDSFWLNLSYLVFAGVMGYVWFKVFETTGIQTGWIERYDQWYPQASMGGAVLLAAASAVWLKRDSERHSYYLASIGELRKVTWPSFNDTKRLTWIVCIVVAIFSGILSLFDFFWAYALRLILAT